jgi:acyl carrier protein
LQQRIHRRYKAEEELLLDPTFFLALQQDFPEITHVQVKPKRGRYHNELTRFRYEAILHIDTPIQPVSDIQWIDWHEHKLTLTEIRRILTVTQPRNFGVRNIPNARLHDEVYAMQWLGQAGSNDTVAQWRTFLSEQPQIGIEPDAIWDLSEELPYYVEISWLNTNSAGTYDVVFTQNSRPFQPAMFSGNICIQSAPDYANDPLQTQFNQQLIGQLRGFLKEKLPDYMLPTAFVVLEKLPLTPNDKVDRQALAQLPIDNYLLSEKTYIAPRNPEEEMLAQLWAEVLDVERVGIHDNFFELGGDSLKAIALLNRVQEQLGKTCQMVDLFNAPTVAEFAARLGEKPSSSQESIDRVPVSSNSDNRYYPPSFIQERFCRYQKVSNSYENPNYFHLAGRLDVAILQKSLNELIHRHEILRTTLQQVNGSLMQVVAPAATVDMSVVDLQSVPEQEQLKEVERLIREEMQRPVALERDPWFRVTLMRLGKESHILLLCMHTLLADVWSSEILLQELSVLYEAFLTGKDSPLPSLPLQYGDYALTQRQSLTAEVLQAKLNYWQQWLSKEPPPLQFRCERPLPAVETFRGGIVEYQLSSELTQQLKTLSQRKQATLFTTLVTAFAIWLYRYSDTEDMVLGVPATDRHHWQFKPLIGRMIKLLVLRIELGGNPSFWELLTQVQQQMLEAMANQDVPFEQVVKTLQPEAERNKPLFRVLIDSWQEPKEQLKLPGLTVTSLPLKELVMKAAMNLVIWEKTTACGTCLEGRWQYKKDLFETDTIARMAANFPTLLEAIVAAPERSVRELSVDLDILEGGRR